MKYTIKYDEKYIYVLFDDNRVSILSIKNIEIINKYCYFSINDSSYLVCRTKYEKNGIKNNRSHRVHRLIMGLTSIESGKVVDHINGNKLDNRHENLRITTHAQNNINKKSYNVSYSNRNKNSPWRAYVNKDGKQIHLGYYDTERDARVAVSAIFKAYDYFSGVKANHCEDIL